MRELWAIFADNLEDAAPVEMIGGSRADLTRVDAIWQTRVWDGRKLHAMWLVTADSGDVIRIYGAVPVAIADRYHDYLNRHDDVGD